MAVISSPQYVWALFTQPLTRAFGASLAQVQVAFSILIVVQTFLSPPQGSWLTGAVRGFCSRWAPSWLA